MSKLFRIQMQQGKQTSSLSIKCLHPEQNQMECQRFISAFASSGNAKSRNSSPWRGGERERACGSSSLTECENVQEGKNTQFYTMLHVANSLVNESCQPDCSLSTEPHLSLQCSKVAQKTWQANCTAAVPSVSGKMSKLSEGSLRALVLFRKLVQMLCEHGLSEKETCNCIKLYYNGS